MYRRLLTYLGLQIDRDWRKILRNRRRMDTLVRRGGPYTSRRLVQLDAATSKLGTRVQDMVALYRLLQKRAA